MAREGRPAVPAVVDHIVDHSAEYSFFEAVRLLRRAGEYNLRFSASSSLGFPAADIAAIAIDSASDTRPSIRITTRLPALSGAHSPLPGFYAEQIATDGTDRPERAQFLDFFHHRLTVLLYDCWEKYRYYIRYEHEARDLFSRRMFALLGLFDDELRPSGRVAWPRLLGEAGLLASRSRSPSVVCALIRDYFGLDAVEIEPFVLRWVAIDESQRCALGGANAVLGESTTVGERVADRAGKFRIVLGPLDLERFRRFLPGGADHEALREFMAVVQHQPLVYDLRLRLKPDAVPPLVLGAASACQLGWSSWLPSTDDAERGVIVPVAA